MYPVSLVASINDFMAIRGNDEQVIAAPPRNFLNSQPSKAKEDQILKRERMQLVGGLPQQRSQINVASRLKFF
jgi:hypothetical protein